jgi:phosphatidylglycerophosphate synthase
LNKTPSSLGKFTTGVEFVAISVGLLLNTVTPRPWFEDLNLLIFYVVAIFVLISGLHYFFRVFESDRQPPA